MHIKTWYSKQVVTGNHDRRDMNDETETPAQTAEDAPVESAETTQEKRRPGRGRPEETIQRDAEVLAKIRELVTIENEKYRFGITRNDLAAELDMAPNVVYLSLFRLGRDGAIKRTTGGAKATWATTEYEVPERPAPAPKEKKQKEEAPAETPAETPAEAADPAV